MDKPEETRRRMREGVRGWLRSTVAGGRKVTPGTITAFLAASAVAPVAAPALSGGVELQPLIDLLGNMGANYLSNALVDASSRIRRNEDGSVDEVELRDALAAELLRRLDASDEAAAEVRTEVANLVHALGGLEELSGSILASSEQTRYDLAAGFQELSGELTALRLSRRREEQAQRHITTELNRLVRQILHERPQPAPAAIEPPDEDVPPAPGDRPYLGLRSFEYADAHLFFGRRNLTDTLLDQLAMRLDGSGPLAVIGPSGSGKSSLLRAALLPSLDAGGLGAPGSEDWPRIVLTPGPTPIDTLAAHVTHLSAAPAAATAADVRADPERLAPAVHQAVLVSCPGPEPNDERERPRLIIVIDQFEELFTLCHDARERTILVDALTHAAQRHALVVIGMRADFFPQCAGIPALVDALGNALVVGPMTAPQLREAIEGPAAHDDWRLEPGLADAVLADLRERRSDAYPAGSLPLMSHALAATWEKRRGRTLTIAGYREAGGLQGSVAGTAEDVYASLDEDARDVARRVLLHLVALGERTEDTRRRLSRAELADRFQPRQAATVRSVIDGLLARRLLVADRDTIEISHEALLRAWPRLGAWMTEDREWLQADAQLAEAAGTWQTLGREPGSLYRGARLAAAREWLDDPLRRAELAPLQRTFLDTSIAAHQAELAAERARSRRLRILAAGLAVMVLIAAAGAVIASRQRADANAQRTSARSRELAAQSDLLRASSAARSMLNALAAWRTDRTPEARSSMIQAGSSPYRGAKASAATEVESAAVSPDGRWIAEAVTVFPDGHGVRTRPVGAPAPNGKLKPLVNTPRTAAVAPGGGITAIDDGDGGVTVVAGDRRVARFDTGPQAAAMAFSSDARTLANTAQDGVVELRNVVGSHVRTRLRAGSRWTALTSVAIAPDSRSVVAGTTGGRLLVWIPSDDGGAKAFTGHTDRIRGLAHRADGRKLASVAEDGTVLLWDLARGRPAGRPASMTTALNAPEAVAFAPDGKLLLVRGANGVELWDVESQRLQATLVDAVAPKVAAFTEDGHAVETVGDDGARRRWSTRPTVLLDHRRAITDTAFAGRDRIVTSDDDESVRVWSRSGRLTAKPLPGGEPIATSPDGRLLALDGPVGYGVRVWNLQRLGEPPTTPRGTATSVASGLGFSDADTVVGAWLLNPAVRFWDVGSDSGWADPVKVGGSPLRLKLAVNARRGMFVIDDGDGEVEFWNASKHEPLGRSRSDQEGTIQSLAFSANGGRLVSVDDEGTVQLWDVARRRSLGEPFDAQGSSVKAAALGPDGRMLVTGGSDHKVRLWDVDRRAVLATLEGHDAPVSAVAFDPDGKALVSGDESGKVALWNLDLDAIARTICAALRGDEAMARELAKLCRPKP